MKKIKLILLSFFVVGGLVAQDLSKLTPEQLDMYKKYMAGKSTPATVTTAPQKDNVEVRKIDTTDSINTTPRTELTPKLAVFGSYFFINKKLNF